MILEGKTYKAVKLGNSTNLISDNHVFTLSNVTQGAFDWDGKLNEASALSFGDNTATRTANTACVVTFPAGGRHIISVYVKYDDLGAPDLTSPADFVFLRSGQISVIPTNFTSLGDDIYRLWFNLDNGVGFSLTTVGIAKTTTATFNARTFKAYGLQVEHAVNPLDEPTDYTATNGTAITTPLPVKLKPTLGNGIVYKPISLLAETDAVLSRAEYEGYTLPNDNGIIALDCNIRERINEGIWQETDYRLMLSHNDALLDKFALINWKSPWSITNLVTQSNNWADSSWGGNTKIPNSPGTLAPDGTQTACYITDVGRTTLVRKTGIIANATSLTYSIYVKPVTATFSTFLFRNETTATNFTSGIITFATGVITGAGWSAQNVGNGWFRVQYTQSTGISIGDDMAIYYGRTSSTGAPSTADWYVWGAQVEDRDKASKYVSTGSNAIYGNGLATAHGGVSYTVNGFDTGGVDGYLNLHYNPSKTGINYQANRGGVGVVLYNSGGYPITQDNTTNSASMLTPSNSAVQRLNNVADLGAAIDLSGDGTKYLQRTGASAGEYTNNGVDGSVTFANSGAITDRFFNVGRARISSAYAYSQTRISMLHVFGNLTAAQRQKSRDIDNKYLQRIGLTPIA